MIILNCSNNWISALLSFGDYPLIGLVVWFLGNSVIILTNRFFAFVVFFFLSFFNLQVVQFWIWNRLELFWSETVIQVILLSHETAKTLYSFLQGKETRVFF